MLLSTGEQVTSALLALTLKELGDGRRLAAGLPDQDRHRFRPREGEDRGDRGGEDHWRPYGRDRSSWSPASRASTASGNITTLRPGRLGYDGGGRGGGAAARTCARSTRTSTASTPPTRTSRTRRGRLDRISYDEMLEMASLGAKVLHIRSVELAKKYKVPLLVKSSFVERQGDTRL